MTERLTYLRLPGATAECDTEELVEYVGQYPSRQVRILLQEGSGYDNPERWWYVNSVYGGPLTDLALSKFWKDDEPSYSESGFFNGERISKEEFEAAWIKSFEYLSRMSRSTERFKWLIELDDGSVIELPSVPDTLRPTPSQ